MKVLWIDDDRLYVRPLAEDMEDLGCVVERVWYVDEGFDRIRQGQDAYDIILVDVMMAARGEFACEDAKAGKRTGLVLLKRIEELNPDLLSKVKVVSVVSDPQVRDFSASMGVEFHLKSMTTAEKILGLPDE